MFEADRGGGGGGSEIVVHPGRLRDAAKKYSDLTKKAQAAVKSVTSAGESAEGAIHHPAVGAAVEKAVTALEQRVGLIGLGLGHCDDGLVECATNYESTDQSTAQKTTSLMAEWGR